MTAKGTSETLGREVWASAFSNIDTEKSVSQEAETGTQWSRLAQAGPRHVGISFKNFTAPYQYIILPGITL